MHPSNRWELLLRWCPQCSPSIWDLLVRHHVTSVQDLLARGNCRDGELPGQTSYFRSLITSVKIWNSLWLGLPNCYLFPCRIWLFTALLILLYSHSQPTGGCYFGAAFKTTHMWRTEVAFRTKISHGYVHALKCSQSLSASCSGIWAPWYFAVFAKELRKQSTWEGWGIAIIFSDTYWLV